MILDGTEEKSSSARCWSILGTMGRDGRERVRWPGSGDGLSTTMLVRKELRLRRQMEERVRP
jgi:hypothetical protein